MFMQPRNSIRPPVKPERGSMQFGCADQENVHPSVQQLRPPTTTRRPLSQLNNGSDKLRMPTTYSPENNTTKKKKLNSDSATGRIYVSKRNERERIRVKLLNMGFERLRAVVPSRSGEKLSKISTLRKAIWYIEHLDRVLHGQENATSDESTKPAVKQPRTTGKRQTSSSNQASRTIRNSGADVATGLASWSDPENNLPLTNDLRGRSVNTKPPSPIFPPAWSNNGISETTFASTPRTSTTFTKHPNETISQESGYDTMGSSGLLVPPYLNTTRTAQQHLLASLENFNNLLPYYTDMFKQPTATALNLSPFSEHLRKT